MKVLADLHQDDLYYSLFLLFVKRLGWELYRPVGFDWHAAGYWKYSENLQTVEQYLRLPDDAILKDGYYEIYEKKHNYFHKAITFEQFKHLDIDIVVASVNQHEQPYFDLIQKHKPRAKLIRQVGNIHDNVDTNICKNLLASIAPIDYPPDINVVFYHQEFEPTTFKFLPPKNYKTITNLMNCLPDSQDFSVWKQYKCLLPEYDWKMYGILGDDGIIGTEAGVAEALHKTSFTWHLKAQADGFGHVIHNAFATGRPPIVKASYYRGQLAGALMIDTVTCIDLEKRNIEDNIRLIRACSRPEVFKRMSENAHRIFTEAINYDEQFEEIKRFLERLK